MEIKLVKIANLKPAEYNPREMTKEQHKHLKESIVKYGFVEPLIVNGVSERFNIVIGGHQRLKIAEELKFTEVPVHYISLDIDREKELNIRLNKNTGQFDWDKLANEFNVDELLDFGFKPFELGFFGDKLNDSQKAKDMYEGMPEFTQEKIAYRSIFVHFKNQEDVNKFADLIKQELSPKNKSYWFPVVKDEPRRDKSYEETT